MMTKKHLGARITGLRKVKGLSQEELAHNTGISRSALAKIEIGQRTVSALELNAIGQALGFSFDDFLSSEFVENNPETAGDLRRTASRFPEKLRAVILYILERCAGKPNVGETVLYKLLYFSDFDYYERYQENLTGMKYRKLPYGPVPLFIEHFINDMIEAKFLRRIKCRYQGYLQTRYLPLHQADLLVLSERDIAVIDRVIGQFSDMSAAAISAWSHNDPPWMLSKNGQVIDYGLVHSRQRAYSGPE